MMLVIKFHLQPPPSQPAGPKVRAGSNNCLLFIAIRTYRYIKIAIMVMICLSKNLTFQGLKQSFWLPLDLASSPQQHPTEAWRRGNNILPEQHSLSALFIFVLKNSLSWSFVFLNQIPKESMPYLHSFIFQGWSNKNRGETSLYSGSTNSSLDIYMNSSISNKNI